MAHKKIFQDHLGSIWLRQHSYVGNTAANSWSLLLFIRFYNIVGYYREIDSYRESKVCIRFGDMEDVGVLHIHCFILGVDTQVVETVNAENTSWELI